MSWCQVAFRTILSRLWPVGRGQDAPAGQMISYRHDFNLLPNPFCEYSHLYTIMEVLILQLWMEAITEFYLG